MTKTYQNLICPLFSTFMEIDGERFDLRFIIGGRDNPKRVNGKFRTSNPKLIKAMDESPFYGVKWVCVATSEPQVEVEAEVVTEEGGVVEVTEPNTVREMREYLNREMGVPYSKLPNRDAAFRVAREMNLEFVNVN